MVSTDCPRQPPDKGHALRSPTAENVARPKLLGVDFGVRPPASDY